MMECIWEGKALYISVLVNMANEVEMDSQIKLKPKFICMSHLSSTKYFPEGVCISGISKKPLLDICSQNCLFLLGFAHL